MEHHHGKLCYSFFWPEMLFLRGYFCLPLLPPHPPSSPEPDLPFLGVTQPLNEPNIPKKNPPQCSGLLLLLFDPSEGRDGSGKKRICCSTTSWDVLELLSHIPAPFGAAAPDSGSLGRALERAAAALNSPGTAGESRGML